MHDVKNAAEGWNGLSWRTDYDERRSLDAGIPGRITRSLRGAVGITQLFVFPQHQDFAKGRER